MVILASPNGAGRSPMHIGLHTKLLDNRRVGAGLTRLLRKDGHYPAHGVSGATASHRAGKQIRI